MVSQLQHHKSGVARQKKESGAIFAREAIPQLGGFIYGGLANVTKAIFPTLVLDIDVDTGDD